MFLWFLHSDKIAPGHVQFQMILESNFTFLKLPTWFLNLTNQRLILRFRYWNFAFGFTNSWFSKNCPNERSRSLSRPLTITITTFSLRIVAIFAFVAALAILFQIRCGDFKTKKGLNWDWTSLSDWLIVNLNLIGRMTHLSQILLIE